MKATELKILIERDDLNYVLQALEDGVTAIMTRAREANHEGDKGFADSLKGSAKRLAEIVSDLESQMVTHDRHEEKARVDLMFRERDPKETYFMGSDDE